MRKRYFGGRLRQLREEKAPPLKQKEVADAVSFSTRKVTQGLIAQYESGKVTLPDASIVVKLADFFEISPGELVFRIALDVIDRYWDDGVVFTTADLERIEILESNLQKIEPIQGLDGQYEEDVLRSAAGLLEQEVKILDVPALVKWQRGLDLTEFWVISPNFLDNTNKDVLDAVLFNLGRGVRYRYFVNENDIEAGGSFDILLTTLVRLGARADKPLSETKVRSLIEAVGIQQWLIGLLQTDIIIAFPRSEEPVGYRSIRYNAIPTFGVPISREELAIVIGQMNAYVKNIEQISKVGQIGTRD